jgi:hypothetical protein
MALNGCWSNGPHPSNPPSVRTHLRDVLGDQAYESLARKGETMTTAAMATYAYDQIDQAEQNWTPSRNMPSGATGLQPQ